MSYDIDNDLDIYRSPISGNIYLTINEMYTVRLTRGIMVTKTEVLICIEDGRTEGYGWELI